MGDTQPPDLAKGPTEVTKSVPGGDMVQDKVKSTTGGLLSKIEGWGSSLANAGRGVVDRIFPPEQRASVMAKIQAFMLKNPKLSTFLGMNIALTGIPLFLFGLFTLVVFITALLVALVVALLAAVAFTLVAVGIALTVLFPTVLFTTGAACFMFLWGLGGYYILKWLNQDPSSGGEGGGELGGKPIGDMLNSITGGRLTGFMDSAKKEQSKQGIEGFSDANNPPETKSESKQPNGKPAGQPQQQVGNAVNKASGSVGSVTKAPNTATNALGTVKGGASGLTGLG